MFVFSPSDIFTLETSDSNRVLEYKMERAQLVSQFTQIASHRNLKRRDDGAWFWF